MTTLGRVTTPDGNELVLYCRDRVYTIRVNGLELMTSRAHGSEEEMARLACQAVAGTRQPRVMVAGLGMGYTLRAALGSLPRSAEVVVVELFAAVVEWCRGPLAELAARPLDDPRVEVVVADLALHLQRDDRTWDVILLDVDNGPEALTVARNDRLYSAVGLERLRSRLRPGGVLAVWSAEPDQAFARRLRRVGLTVRCEAVPARGRGHQGPEHCVFLARRSGG